MRRNRELAFAIFLAVSGLSVAFADGVGWTCPNNGTANCAGASCTNPPSNSCDQISAVNHSTCKFTGNSADSCTTKQVNCAKIVHYSGGPCNTTTGKCGGMPNGSPDSFQQEAGCP